MYWMLRHFVFILLLSDHKLVLDGFGATYNFSVFGFFSLCVSQVQLLSAPNGAQLAQTL